MSVKTLLVIVIQMLCAQTLREAFYVLVMMATMEMDHHALVCAFCNKTCS